MAGKAQQHGSVVAVEASDPSLPLRPSNCPPYPVTHLATRLDARLDHSTPVAVTGVTLDSQAVRRGDLFVALPGARTHGARFAVAAVRAGSTAVLTDTAGAELLPEDLAAQVLIVDDVRAAMATAAAEIYQRPAQKMIMLGVTGTAGKTTTTSLLAAGLSAAGYSYGLIGTLGYFLNDDRLDATRTTITTPESPDLQALLAVFAERGAQAVAMEVSSHALALGRVEEICFEVAGFTNLGSDHLDFHGSAQAYFEAKAQLFTSRARRAVINVDDPHGAELLRRRRAAGLPAHDIRPASCDAGAGTSRSAGGYRYAGIDHHSEPPPVRLTTPDRELNFALALPGHYNVLNATIALAMLDQADVPVGRAAPGLAGVVVPGRLQRVRLGSAAPHTFVDFAHTPQAVETVLTELALIQATGRLIGVLGCGGDRDPEKRAPMGAAAARCCDVVIITDDNPRTEDPAIIRAAVTEGARSATRQAGRDVTIMDGGDRRSAIRQAIDVARPDDVVAVLGKGHERGQEINHQLLPFDDVEEIAMAWRQTAADSRNAGQPS